MADNELMKLLDSGVLASTSRKIYFYAPSFMHYKTNYYSEQMEFPTISVTGNRCMLRCKHCGGKVLDTMHSVTSPEELLEVCRKLKNDGAIGCLISGGCLHDGSVPLNRFLKVVGKVKNELGLTVLVHTGIIDVDTAKSLKESNVDAVLIDIIGSDDTIREIYNLDATVQDYARSLAALDKVGLPFVPHVVVGLHHGELKGELHALKLISRYAPSALVIIAFMPIRGTEMSQTKPPKPSDIAKVIATARVIFPKTPLVLGCMRPKGKRRVETDVLALKAGADAIAFPEEQAVMHAMEKGYEVVFSSFCCAQVHADLRISASLL